jgi:hypothetical protein
LDRVYHLHSSPMVKARSMNILLCPFASTGSDQLFIP